MARCRCDWATHHPLLETYHDTEWGVPLRDDQKLFEFLVLDAFQAGLSWLTVLKKRENFRRAFDGYDIEKIARYSPARIQKLMQDEGIIRNRLKIESTVGNAKAFLEVCEKEGTFAPYIWQFTQGKTLVSRHKTLKDIPAKTAEAEMMSKTLKKRGFRFVGPTICYAFMQASGMVNDHLLTCFRYDQV